VAVLSAFGTRVYERVLLVVDARDDDLAVDEDDHPHGGRGPQDRYSDLADRTPGTLVAMGRLFSPPTRRNADCSRDFYDIVETRT
jgi:hypothetical protein